MTTKRRLRRSRLRLCRLEDRTAPALLHTFLTHEHVDLNIGFTGGSSGAWSLVARDSSNAVSHPLDEALLYVGTNAVTNRPAGSEFAFIGVGPNAPFYRLPASQATNLLYLGAAATNIAASSLDRYDPITESKNRVSGEGRWAKMTLLSVNGPGHFSVWQSGDTGPVVFMSTFNNGTSDPDSHGLDTTDGISPDDALWILSGGHSHFNWGFTALGRYEITVKLSGYLDDGNTSVLGTYVESNPITFYVSVGNIGRIQFDASAYQVNEHAGTATITVQRVGGSDGRITVAYAVTDGTAVDGVDYTASSGTFTFNDQETSKTISVPIINDSLDEPNETVHLGLSSPGPANLEAHLAAAEGSSLLGTNSTAVLTILNDDAPANNTPPTIGDVPDQATNEDVPTGAIAVTIGDTESALDDLILTATSSNQTIVPNANISLGGSGANRTVVINPAANQFGTVTITLTVTDTGGLTATDTFDLVIAPVNDAPVANSQTLTTPQETNLPIVLTGSDIENDPLTFTVLTLPAHGSLLGSAPNLTYVPQVGFVGTDSFTFRVNDGMANSLPATVTIHVTAEHAPSAHADAYVVSPGNQIFGNVLANDHDEDGDPLTLTAILITPNHGTLDWNADGSFTYIPGPTFAGTDLFRYEVSDDTGRTSAADVTIAAAGFQPFTAVLAQDHADIGIGFHDAEWEAHIHDEEHEAEYEPNGAIFFVSPLALTARPGGTAFDFIGVGPGELFYRLPQNPNPDLVFIGLATEEIAPGTFQGGLITLALRAVNGPGHLSVWEATDSGPNVLWATSDGIGPSDALQLSEGVHAHFNWGFTAPGRYEVTFEAHGTLTGETEPTFSGPISFYFSVDHLGTISFSALRYGVAEGGMATITLVRTGGSDGPLTVEYATADGSAIANLDYLPATGSITFADGETEKTFTVATLKDRRKEPVESLALNLSVPQGSAAQLGAIPTAALDIDLTTPLRVTKILVNDGQKQRSNIVTISVRFNRDTNLGELIANGAINQAVRLFAGATEIPLATGRFFYDPLTRTLHIGLTTGGF
ncbi:MAG: choice-of-anchor M domain-containing protein, partial [Nitrospira sp.]|nr:choice-of-anchor M domain-containing protein [Nitrospira sp.]